MFQTLFTQPLANGLILFYKVLGNNMGLAIIGFSLFLRFILNPLTKPYMESMKKMKDIAPQINKLKEKYKGDKIKFAQAQADFYKNKGIKPGAGCLPYILQIIILIAFFNVFTKTFATENVTQAFNDLLYSPLVFGAGEAVNTTFLYLDLKNPDTFNFTGVPFPMPGPLLFFAAVLQLVSAKIMQPFTDIEEKVAKKTKDTTDDMQVAMQQSMTYTFPLMTLFIGVRFSSALALYWLVFSITQSWQQYKSQGWGGLTPWLKRLGLLQSGK
ncbi:MAG TPA: YidC/Oxa1 family membrane protein insertase [Mariniflexile sp.]